MKEGIVSSILVPRNPVSVVEEELRGGRRRSRLVSFERIEWNLLNFAIFFGLDDGETIVAFGNLFEVKIICFFFFFFFFFLISWDRIF